MSLDGDLASLRALAAKTRANIQSAPLGWRRTEDTIQSLNTLLDRIETDSKSNTSIIQSDEAVKQQLGVLVKQCLVSITKLCDAIEQSSKPQARALDNVEQFRLELSVRYNDLVEFVNEAGCGEMKSMDDGVDGSKDQETLILEAVDKILTDESNKTQERSTMISEHKDDHTAVWKHLLAKLKLSGFKSADVERHKESVFHKLHETLHLHHAASDGAVQSPRVNKLHVRDAELVQPINTQAPAMSFKDHLQTQTAARSGNYRPPAASTIYDDSDDDAISVTSEASTLLGPINERPPRENYATQPRSPRFTVQIPDDKIVDLSSSPREPPSRAFSNMNVPFQNRSIPRNNGASMPRPTSPRERDPRYGGSNTLPRSPSSLRNTSTSSQYDYDTIVGRRSTSNRYWRYRRNGDMFPPRNQSMDVQDSALPTAAEDGRIAEVERLLWDNRNVESFGSRNEHQGRSFYRTTALYRAARNGHLTIVHLLLRYGAHPNPSRQDGKSLVRLLADDGSDEMLRLLLEYEADIHRQGALPQAAWSGHFNVVQLLLEYGADMNEIEKDQTALYRAASKGHPQIVDLLLREGADPQFITSRHSALYKAVEHENFQCVRLLLQYGARPAQSILYVAVESGNEHIVRELLRRGALPNEFQAPIDGRRRYPLHIAARGGHLGTARLLLDYAADPNVLTEDGRGPVDIAIEQRHNDMIDLLSRAGGFPQQVINEKGPGYRVQDVDSPRASHESQVRKFSSSLPERPQRLRRPSALPASRSFENDSKRRDRSANGPRRSDSALQQGSSSSKFNVPATLSIVASGLMFLGGV